jgi:16S rRNA G527 N7-methylase RsmG
MSKVKSNNLRETDEAINKYKKKINELNKTYNMTSFNNWE